MANITLLSDFGLQDASVASAKGILMQQVPNASITDISHLVEPYHVQQAAYILNATYNNFPVGSFHIILCDIFSEQVPRLLLCSNKGHYFLAPDNGILSLAFNNRYDAAWTCLEMHESSVITSWLIACGKVIQSISNGVTPGSIGLEAGEITNKLVHWQPKISASAIECHIIHIDRFENVVINLTRTQFETAAKSRQFRIQFARNEVTEISRNYGDVRQDEMLCRFNSTGYLEIAINRGKAASLLGLKLSKEQHLIYNSIKIIFE